MGLLIGSTGGTTLSWSKPPTLANGDAIPGSTITGYKVYSSTGGAYSLLDTISDEDTLSLAVAGTVGTKYAVATTWSGNQSPLSPPAETPNPPTTTHTVSSSDSLATINSAIAGLSAGDVLEFADGTYSNTTNTPITIAVSGSSGNPITIRGASATGVILQGADYSVPESGAQIAVVVSGDYLNISNFVTEDYSTGKFWAAWRVYGDNNNISECRFHDNYGGGLFIGANNPATNITVKNCLCRNSGAFTGFAFRHTGDASVTDDVDNCYFIDCVSYYNGYSDAGVTLFGDSPGNADSVGISKEFSDNSIDCTDSGFLRCVSFRSADDILDFSVFGSGFVAVNNVLFYAGTEGGRIIKEFNAAASTRKVIGNLCFDSPDVTLGFGIVTRSGAGSDGSFTCNNSVLNTQQNGLHLLDSGVTETTATKIQNNMIYLTGGFVNQLSSADTSNNHTTGDPEVVDDTKLFGSQLDLDLSGLTVKAAHKKILDQAWKWGMPDTTGSPLYDGGVNDANVHMATADDNATTPADPEDQTKVHWTNTVPDIGAVPYRYIDPPPDVSIT